MNPIFDFDVKGQIFNFKLYPNELKNNLYKYKYYDTIEKKKQKIKQILFKCDCSIIIRKLNIFLFMTQKMVRKLQMQCLGIGIVFLSKTKGQINGMEQMQMFFLKRQTMQFLKKKIAVLQNFFGIICSYKKRKRLRSRE